MNSTGTILNKKPALNGHRKSPSVNGVPKQTKLEIVTLAHEIRNPLTNINLAIDVLENMTKEGAILELSDIIRRNSEKINVLVKNFLHLNYIGAESAGIISIDEVLNGALEMAKDRIALKKIKIEKLFTICQCDVFINYTTTKIALLNIILNAIEAIKNKDGVLTIITKVRNGKCIITIQDNGIGIPKENIRKLFKPGFTSKLNGGGFGLPAASQILHSQKAKIRIKSEENIGTQFIISLNLAANTY
ncbi:MAG: HAMP domain-containing histidine kinase [Fimbriimonadaceae bacterium]|nr:HAMP domain-containing histidine kinase [Chitinophagales bacterium]